MLKGSDYGKEPHTYAGLIARHKEWLVFERGTSAVASRVPDGSRWDCDGKNCSVFGVSTQSC